ncbi:MAG: hypothetical protein AAF725_17855 [Acidobacteriota bacterium]
MTDLTYATLLQLRLEAARRLGCEIVPLDPETGFLYELRYRGKTRLLHGGLSPLNDAVAARIASDKFHTGLVVQAAGFRFPASARCLRPGHFRSSEFDEHTGHEPARRFAKAHGFPLVIKPNRGSRGLDITVAADGRAMEEAIDQVWKRDYLALVQTPVAGIDLRLDLLDGEFLFGYVRRPVTLEGDGRRTVRELLADLDPRFSGEAFERHLTGDEVWRRNAGPRGWRLDTLPEAGDRLVLKTPILNLNRLCLGERLAGIDEAWLETCRTLSRRTHLRHIGIDFKVPDADAPPSLATVIEVKSSPSLAHMSRMGFAREALEAETRVVRAMLDAVAAPALPGIG